MSSIEIAERPAAKPAGRPAKRLEKDRTPRTTDGEIRKFGLVAIVGFGAFGGLFFWRRHVLAAEVFWAIGAALGALAIAAPGPARPVYRAWMAAAHVLGRVNTAVIITVFHLVLVTGLGLVFRLIGRDALRLEIDREAKTYWQPKAMPRDARRYFDQF